MFIVFIYFVHLISEIYSQGKAFKIISIYLQYIFVYLTIFYKNQLWVKFENFGKFVCNIKINGFYRLNFNC